MCQEKYNICQEKYNARKNIMLLMLSRKVFYLFDFTAKIHHSFDLGSAVIVHEQQHRRPPEFGVGGFRFVDFQQIFPHLVVHQC